MTARRSLASDISGLTKKPPLSRRDFMSASAAIAAGYTLAAGPVRAEAIKTDTNGLDAGMSSVKVDGGAILPNRSPAATESDDADPVLVAALSFGPPNRRVEIGE